MSRKAEPSQDDGVTLRRDYLSLLSAAQRCQITVPREDIFDGPQLISIVLRDNHFIGEGSHPLIPPSPAELASFLLQALPLFRALEADYSLERLIWYYCRSFTEQYSEPNFIFASVFMEALKFYWAKNVAKHPPVMKANGLVKGFERAKNVKGDPILYTFEELIVGAGNHLGFPTTFTFIEDRNALFHSGASGAVQKGAGSTWPALKPELWKLYDQMDDLLLRILGYRGPIYPYDGTAPKVDFPSRRRIP